LSGGNVPVNCRSGEYRFEPLLIDSAKENWRPKAEVAISDPKAALQRLALVG
jgi:hypothetical protein